MDDENEIFDRDWTHCIYHAATCRCDGCEESYQRMRRRRADGLKCTCLDPRGTWCDLHEVTLNNG
jgi:hypothetical protein